MPVYGAEQTLERSVRSVQAQTLASWELIAVDDGSPDRSGAMLDRMAAADRRIRVIHQPNRGVAAARQAGLEHAKGAYAIHVDPDDWVEPTMLEELVGEARRTGADMVVCDYYNERNGQVKLVRQQPSALSADALARDLFQRLHGSCCNKLISSACYTCGRFYPGMNMSEDLLYICEVLSHGPKIAYLPKAYYHYMISAGGSMTSSASAAKFRQLAEIYRRLEALFAEEAEIAALITHSKASYMGNMGACAKDLGFREYRSAMGPGAMRRVWRNNNLSLSRKLLIIAALAGLKKTAAKILSMKR